MKKPHSILFASLIAVTLLAAVGAAQEPAKSSSLGIVSAPLANVHDEPLPKSLLKTQVLMGDEVRILEKKDNRYRVAIPSQMQREGWIQQEAVHILKDKGRSYLNADRKWVVITTLKSDALILDKTGNHKVSLYAGTRLPVIETTKDGYKVQFPDKSVAIIDSADAMPEKSLDPIVNDTKPEEIVQTAKRFQGVQYLSGGLSAQGMDSTGLVYISYRIHGFPLSTDRETLRVRAERIAKKDVEPSDILVFSGDSLGLFLGSGRFIQVPKKRTAQIAGISGSLQYAIRIIGSGPDEKKRAAEMTADEILLDQARVARLPIGKRIAFWAGRFLGTPYDPDPLGLYVRTNRIIADEKADCMYHTFRSVELAQSSTPREAVDRALNLRFMTQGKLADGIVTNYDERYQYGEDMVFSGKWGKNITRDLGTTSQIAGTRGKSTVDILPKKALATRPLQQKLRDGDIVFWVKDPRKRAVDEVVAHISIVHIKSGKPYLIHASGDKTHADRPGGGVVKEVSFADYVRMTRFIGALVTRFEQ